MSLRLPWRDRAGRFSRFKALVFALMFVPAGLMLWDYSQGLYAARVAIEFNHASGLWAIRLLILSLAVTPLRQDLRWPGLIHVRRMIGVAAFCYTLVHLVGFFFDQKLDWFVIAREIALRFYLTIGFVVLLMLVALASTSTDGMMKRMGGKAWQKLHYLAYPAMLLAVVHFFLQSKIGVAEPTVLAGLFVWLMAHRLIVRQRAQKGEGLSPVALGLLTLGVAALTVLGEAGYFAAFTGIDPWRVLNANLDFVGQRPAWVVLMIGIGVAVLAALRRLSLPAFKAKQPRVAVGR